MSDDPKKCTPCDVHGALKHVRRSVELLERALGEDPETIRLHKAALKQEMSDFAHDHFAEPETEPETEVTARVEKVAQNRQPFMPPEKAPPLIADMTYHGTKLVIMTTFSDFNPSYSLTTVVLDQARAGVMAGFDVYIVVMETVKLEACPVIEGVTWIANIGTESGYKGSDYKGVPFVHWKEDEIDEDDAHKIQIWLIYLLNALTHDFDGDLHIITHDLVFQSWHLVFAYAIHSMNPFDLDSEAIYWYHQAHSCTGARPEDLNALRYRARLPDGHQLLAENWSEIPYLCQYYQTTPDRIITIPNIRDCRGFLNMSKELTDFVTTHQIHRADVAQVYPISTTRAYDKGVKKVLEIFGELKKKRQTVRLVLANAHANGEIPEKIIEDLQVYARACGLENGVEVLWTSMEIENTRIHGLGQDDIRSLFEITNIFVFPSYSEACGLVMLEAAMTGNLLFLNRNVPAMGDFFPMEVATHIQWNSIRSPQSMNMPATAVANMILGQLATNIPQKAKRRLLKQFSLEGMAERMYGLWGPKTLEEQAVLAKESDSVP